jgi:hypothetical protein
MKEKEFNIYDILEDLELRKSLYLGNHFNFDSLDSFINGFTLAAKPKQLKREGLPNFGLFSAWLLGHLTKHYGQAGGWHWQIKNRNKTDKKAFAEFFQFLKKFKKSMVRKKTIAVDKKAIEFPQNGPVKRFLLKNGKQTKISKKPSKIVWTTLSNSKTVWVDYLDDKNRIIAGFWELDVTKANKTLRIEFGRFRNQWKVLSN